MRPKKCWLADDARLHEVSRARLQNLVNEMKALGDIKGDIAFERIVMPGLTRLVE